MGDGGDNGPYDQADGPKAGHCASDGCSDTHSERRRLDDRYAPEAECPLKQRGVNDAEVEAKSETGNKHQLCELWLTVYQSEGFAGANAANVRAAPADAFIQNARGRNLAVGAGA